MRQTKLKKRALSLLLAFSMVMSLFTGQTIYTSEVQASSEAQIDLKELKKSADGTYYTYPDAVITHPDSDKKFHSMTVSVDFGHLKITSTEIADIAGLGIIAGSDMNVDFETLSTANKYESISFEWPEGATMEQMQSFIRTIQFTTSNRVQTVSIHATTKSSADLKTTISGKEVQLFYFNGHYYGYVPMDNKKWSNAYKESKSATFCGAQGYLATLTSRAEDRFILASFKDYGNYAKKGWLGCSRAVLADGSSYTDADTTWKDLTKFDFATCEQDFVWRWVSGPEAGQRFGYQNHAFGDGTYGDGGFVTDNGMFSNWNNSSNIEPNGGASTNEAFGYYGKYEYGRWNDNADDSEDGIYGYYIEFGGFDGDEAKFEESLDQIIISTTKVTDDIITDGSYKDSTNTETEKTPISGKPVIKNQTTDDDGNPIVKEGTVLSADVSGVIPDAAHDGLSYQWYIKNPNGTLAPIDGAIEKNLTLTTDTIDKELVVKAFASGDYTGEVVSDPYDTTRTNSGIDTEEDADTTDDKGTLVIYPTVENTIYGIKDEEGNVYGLGSLDALPAVDGDGNTLTPNASGYPGYYQVEPGSKIVFTIDNDKNYIVHEIQLESDTTNTEVVSPTIPDSDITTDYDKNNSTETADDTISIVIDPALTDYKYAVLKKVDGKYVEVPMTKDAEGNYVASPNTSTNPWSDGGENVVTFTGLPADGTYKVIAVTSSDSADTDIKELTPDQVIGGSEDITATAPEEVKTPISGKPVIINGTTDDDGSTIVKEGSVLTATLAGVAPINCHTSLTYQWYVKNSDDTLTPIDGATAQSYTLTADTVDKELVVKAFGNGNYTGEVESNPYDTTRTNSGIDVGDDPIDVPGATPLPDDKRTITINPTMKDTIYAIKDENGNVYGAGDLTALPAVDGNGNTLTPNVTDSAYAGYYQIEAGGKIVFTVDKNKNYIIHEVKNTSTNTEVISPTIPDSDIETKYDDNNTANNKADDTISITVAPALSDYKYAVLKKVDGKYVEVTVAKDANGNYALSDTSTSPWSNGGETEVTFTGLPADGTYRIVAVSSSDSADTIIKDLTPDQIIGGSADITAPAPGTAPTPSVSPSAAPLASPSANPASGSSFTQTEIDAADKFIKEHATDPNGKIVTEITDLTRDIVVSGETKWNNFTEKEKAAVNERLKEQGCPYTFQQLLDMAKGYKIPGFKVKKYMKKGTKSKLKLVKCKGATIVCTSTNKKVATVNKKGVIKAKKVGKATLTFTAIKGIHTNRLVIKIIVKKKFKNAKELKKFKNKAIKTPTVLIAKKRVVKASTKIRIYDLKKGSKYKYTSLNKKVLKITKKGKYTGKKPGSSLVRVKIHQNDKDYLLYVYVTIYPKKAKSKKK